MPRRILRKGRGQLKYRLGEVARFHALDDQNGLAGVTLVTMTDSTTTPRVTWSPCTIERKVAEEVIFTSIPTRARESSYPPSGPLAEKDADTFASAEISCTLAGDAQIDAIPDSPTYE